MSKPKRIHFTVIIERKGSDGPYKALVADHGGRLPGADDGNVRVASIREEEATSLASLVSVALYKGMRDHGLLGVQQDQEIND